MKGYQLQKLRYDYNTQDRIAKYLERENWSKKNWHYFRSRKIEEILYIAREHVPYYKNYWNERKKMSGKSSWEELKNWPILNKQDVLQNEIQFIDERLSITKLYQDHTSGTTGTALNIFLSPQVVKEQYALFEARVKKKYNIELDETWAIIGSQRITDINRTKPPFWVYNYASSQLYLSSLHIADWTIIDYVDALKKYQPKCLVGYTNSIYQLALGMVKNKQVFKLKAVITNAEPLYQYQSAIIAEAFKCPVVETYGQAELVCFASRFPDGKMYESPEMGISEVVDVKKYEDGEYGKLVATGIINNSMPLIRYDTNDLISNNKRNHSDGKLPEYGKILGRNDDIIVLEDGRNIVQIDGIFNSDINIIQGQIIQETVKDFIIKVVPASNWTEQNKEIIRSSLYERLGQVNINIELCDKIETSWAGKFRVIQSNIKSKNQQ